MLVASTSLAEQAKTPKSLPPAATRQVDFVRDVEPIFAARCNHCHGPDEQQGQLRLDAKAIVLKGGQGGLLLVAGKSSESLLIQRVVGLGTEKQMPLEDDPLSDAEIGILRAWIDQGANWPAGVGSPATEVKKHWAYVAPRSPPLPSVRDSSWPRSPIDSFILARLEREGVAPSPPTERERLLRRASLDLIGLPPSVAEVDEFLADASPDAYERQLDRLLASPAYGERWATPWLDAARYADSNGYQRDGHRTIWPYRDWVIRALNADLPFDQFTIEQLAGDLLPQATIEQRVATGFQRCTTVNVEAGTDQEEDRTNQVIDRVNVLGTVWLGTTLECCQCHNHKYDPFTQRDYYRLFAYFNNTPLETEQRSKGSASLDFASPEIRLPDDLATEQRREDLTARKSALAAELDRWLADEASGVAAWERELTAKGSLEAQELPANIRKLMAIDRQKRKPNQQQQLATYYISINPAAKKLQARIDALDKQLEALAPPTSLVMTELPQPRMTTIFQRGSFLAPGEQVLSGTPRVLPASPEGAGNNRLALARWLTAPTNPLTARVQVNRAWGQFFGRGIVASEEDLGTQCEPPTHPELLDWLAVEFQIRGWSQKHIYRRIAESAAYRQSSKFRSELAAKDPHNLLIARGPRQRLSAEAIRDNALAISGRLAPKMHGPPTRPPQPEGIWRVTGAVDNTYRTSTGEDAWRRGVYTVQRRSAPYPSFSSFDAPDRSACTVKRPRSNSPLQALTLQNDPVYVELAAAFADRLAVETAGFSRDEALIHAYRTATCRRPTDRELVELRAIDFAACQRYASDPKAAQHLAGGRALPAGTTAPDWSAWFNLAHVLLNLDETITKN
ncbi:MAG: PSD1 and planctomycete cytochrome C domain-containing protein [Pirellulaceae bacterium]|nr:PSD1 and planctomycete cytochrome C domain-containing protein [Pirellulaceae bacterium]